MRSNEKHAKWLWRNLVARDTYLLRHRETIGRLLARSEVAVACNPENIGQIFGWAAGESLEQSRPILHYVYVKCSFRRLGIGRALFDAITDSKPRPLCSHWSEVCCGKGDRLGLEFDPYLLVGQQAPKGKPNEEIRSN